MTKRTQRALASPPMIMAPEDVAEDDDEQPDPKEEDEELEHRPEDAQQRIRVCDHGSPRSLFDRSSSRLEPNGTSRRDYHGGGGQFLDRIMFHPPPGRNVRGQVTVADLALLGLAVTLEPLPIMAFILVLASRRGPQKGLAFIVGLDGLPRSRDRDHIVGDRWPAPRTLHQSNHRDFGGQSRHRRAAGRLRVLSPPPSTPGGWATEMGGPARRALTVHVRVPRCLPPTLGPGGRSGRRGDRDQRFVMGVPACPRRVLPAGHGHVAGPASSLSCFPLRRRTAGSSVCAILSRFTAMAPSSSSPPSSGSGCSETGCRPSCPRDRQQSCPHDRPCAMLRGDACRPARPVIVAQAMATLLRRHADRGRPRLGSRNGRLAPQGFTRIARAVFALADRLLVHGWRNPRRTAHMRALYAPVALVTLPLVWMLSVTVAFTFIFWGIGSGTVAHSFELSGSSLTHPRVLEARWLGPDLVASSRPSSDSGSSPCSSATYRPFTRPTPVAEGHERAATLRRNPTSPSPSSEPASFRQPRQRRGVEVGGRLAPRLDQTHTSFPALCYFPDTPDQSWVASLGSLLDGAALLFSGAASSSSTRTRPPRSRARR